jgi:hypothetical protein
MVPVAALPRLKITETMGLLCVMPDQYLKKQSDRKDQA